MKNSSYDGRSRRTMQEAFGPYTSHEVVEPCDGSYSGVWWSAMIAIAIMAVTAVVLTS